MPRLLKTDTKLQEIFAAKDPEQLAKNIKNGYLNGRAITMLFDMLPDEDSNLTIELNIYGRIKQISSDQFEAKTKVKKLSFSIFWLSEIIHKFGMWTNVCGYRDFKDLQIQKIIEAYNLAVTNTPSVINSLQSIQNTPYKFSQMAFESIPQPQTFTGTLISETDLNSLLTKHEDLLNDVGAGTHGHPKANILMGFKNGTIQTTARGIQPIIENNPEGNQEFIHRMQVVMTLINQAETKLQARLMERLATSFKACNVGRADIIRELYNEFLFIESDSTFEELLKSRLQMLKHLLFLELLNDLYPQNIPQPKYLRMIHLLPGFLNATGQELGMEGLTEAAGDTHAYRVPPADKEIFLEAFKERFNNSFDTFCIEQTKCVNNPNDSFTEKYGAYFNQRIKTEELPADFALFTEEKKNLGLYNDIDEPCQVMRPIDGDSGYTEMDKVEFGLQFYTSPAEMKQLLEMIGFIEPAQHFPNQEIS